MNMEKRITTLLNNLEDCRKELEEDGKIITFIRNPRGSMFYSIPKDTISQIDSFEIKKVTNIKGVGVGL